MLVDLHCPIELKGYEILTDSIANRTFCAVSFFNLSDKIVTSVRFNLYCYDSFGDPVGEPPSNKVEAVIQDENAIPKSVFGIKKRIPLPMHSETRAIEIIVSRIKFADGTIWDNDEKGIIRINIAKIKDLDELYALKTIFGEDATCYFREEENWWICLCSRINTFNDTICRRCGRAKEYVSDCCSEQSRVNYEFELNKQREEERKKNLLIEQEEREKKLSAEEEERKKNLIAEKRQKTFWNTLVLFVSGLIVLSVFFLIYSAILPDPDIDVDKSRNVETEAPRTQTPREDPRDMHPDDELWQQIVDDLEELYDSTSTPSSSTSRPSCGHDSCAELGPFYCMGKNDTCNNRTGCAYVFYCSSCR